MNILGHSILRSDASLTDILRFESALASSLPDKRQTNKNGGKPDAMLWYMIGDRQYCHVSEFKQCGLEAHIYEVLFYANGYYKKYPY